MYYTAPTADESGEESLDEEATYDDLHDSFHEAVESLLSSVGVDRYGNVTYEGVGENPHEVIVKLQIGSGEEIDLTGRSFFDRSTGEGRDIEMLHLNGML